MKTQKLILTFVFLLCFLFHNAQEKYEFMTIAYNSQSWELIVSVDGKQIIPEKITLEKDDNTRLNTNPLLKKVSEYQAQDWEVITFNTIAPSASGPVYYAYLRKKKADKK